MHNKVLNLILLYGQRLRRSWPFFIGPCTWRIGDLKLEAKQSTVQLGSCSLKFLLRAAPVYCPYLYARFLSSLLD
jgi:hypothetical protein